jgi:hypothetical protein
MSPAVFLAILMGLGFKTQELTERRLLESGVSPLRVFALLRYALIPSLLWAVIVVRSDDLRRFIDTPLLMRYILFIALVWNIQCFILHYLLSGVIAMTSFSTLRSVFPLPVMLLVGWFYNHDIPSILSGFAILSLFAAFLLNPSQHEGNAGPPRRLSFFAILGLALLASLLEAANAGVSRKALQMLSPPTFLAFFSVPTIALCWLWTSFFKSNREERQTLAKYRKLALAVPVLWFAASIPESWAYKVLPIYIVVSIGAISFFVDTLSDLRRRRIRFSVRTVIFIVLALCGIGLAVYAVRDIPQASRVGFRSVSKVGAQ